MSDLISRSALIEALRKDKEAVYSHVFCHTECQFEDELADDLEQLINNQPTIEAVPVVKAEWEECDWVAYDWSGECVRYPRKAMKCSNCSNAFKKELLWKHNFCPNCGADMRKGGAE
jgi:PHP family Zn ribbon phosphoesterase